MLRSLSANMDHSSKSKSSLTLDTKIKVTIVAGNQVYVPETSLEEEKARICKSKVLISLYVFDKTHVFLGSLPDPNAKAGKLKEFFPCYHHTKPIVYSKQTTGLNHMSASFHVFLSEPSTKNR